MTPVASLWRCPKCGRMFANRHQEHSCGTFTVEAFLEDKSADTCALYHRFVELVERCGPVLIAPAKTRIGFQVRMIFAAVNHLSERRLDAHVVLRRRIETPRFRKIETLTPTCHVHHFRVTALEELDDEVMTWLCEAYTVGEQRHLGES